jgi:methionyl-tRNA synthetase
MVGRPPQQFPRRVLITATPPTPNGDLHVGHLSGPYLGADIYRRYLRLHGVECYYITGTDDHQSYTAFKGEQLGWTAESVAEHFGEAMLKTLEAAEIVPDVYAWPRRSEFHVPFVQKFFSKLHVAGKLLVKEAPSLFCSRCDRYIFEAFVSGKCPHCLAASGGNACEDCGQPNDCVDLIDPVCKSCGSRPEIRSLKKVYFPLARYAEQLKSYYESANMSPHLRALCERMLNEGLPEIALTHPAEWGVPVPLAGFEKQRLYVWFEMAPGFLAATEELTQKLGRARNWADYWKQPDSSIVHFFGFDNGYFFAVLFPALFLAYDPQIRLPKTFVTNEFYRLTGLKFSTSRNHAVWGRELLSQSSLDAVRFYLAYTNPEREQSNFTREDFYSTVQREPAGAWQAWLQELGQKTKNECGNQVPVVSELEDEQKQFCEALQGLIAEIETAYSAETFSPQLATRACCELVRRARRFGKSEDHWRHVPGREERRSTSIALELLAAKVLAVVSIPVVPGFSVRLWKSLGYTSPISDMRWDKLLERIPAGAELSGLDVLAFDDSKDLIEMKLPIVSSKSA